jgi:hypothetical protein
VGASDFVLAPMLRVGSRERRTPGRHSHAERGNERRGENVGASDFVLAPMLRVGTRERRAWERERMRERKWERFCSGAHAPRGRLFQALYFQEIPGFNSVSLVENYGPIAL